jgi:hypothetical protein
MRPLPLLLAAASSVLDGAGLATLFLLIGLLGLKVLQPSRGIRVKRGPRLREAERGLGRGLEPRLRGGRGCGG